MEKKHKKKLLGHLHIALGIAGCEGGSNELVEAIKKAAGTANQEPEK